MNLYDFLFVLIVLALYVVKDYVHEARTDKLLNRIQAKDYEQYRYYQDKYKGDLKELERVRDVAHKGEDLAETELKQAAEPEKVDLADFEEDWADEEPPQK